MMLWITIYAIFAASLFPVKALAIDLECSQPNRQASKPLLEFLQTTFESGVVPEDAVCFKDALHQHQLKAILLDPTKTEVWSNAAVTLAISGGLDAIPYLLDFFRSGSGPLPREHYVAKLSALSAIGFALHQYVRSSVATADKNALRELSQLVWKRPSAISRIRWLPPDRDEKRRNNAIVESALKALGFSGKPAAEAELKRYINSPKTSISNSADIARQSLKVNQAAQQRVLNRR